MVGRDAGSPALQEFLFAELHVSLEITLGAQESEAAESVEKVSEGVFRFYNANLKRFLSNW